MAGSFSVRVFIAFRFVDVQRIEHPNACAFIVFLHGIKIGSFSIVLKNDPIPALRRKAFDEKVLPGGPILLLHQKPASTLFSRPRDC